MGLSSVTYIQLIHFCVVFLALRREQKILPLNSDGYSLVQRDILLSKLMMVVCSAQGS